MKSDAEKELEHLIDLWNDTGRVPEYHELQKKKLKNGWPLLYYALDRISQKKLDFTETTVVV